MKKIGIIGAMEEEVVLLKEKMAMTEIKEMAGMSFYEGSMQGHTVVVVRSGIGKVNAAVCTQILIDMFKVEAIINTGVAGALDANLNIGDIIISLDTVQHDVDVTGFGYALGEIPRMDTSVFKAETKLVELAKTASQKVSQEHQVYIERIVSGDQFISNMEVKNKIYENFKGYCTEMEGAAIAQVCYLNKIPFVVIRAISDKADQSAEINFNEFSVEAARHSSEMIEYMIEAL